MFAKAEGAPAPNQLGRGVAASDVSQDHVQHDAHGRCDTLYLPTVAAAQPLISHHQQSLKPTRGLPRITYSVLPTRLHTAFIAGFPAPLRQRPPRIREGDGANKSPSRPSKYSSKSLEWTIFAPESWLIRGTPTYPRPRSLAISFLSAVTVATESERAA